jgi:hypothetical protein
MGTSSVTDTTISKAIMAKIYFTHPAADSARGILLIWAFSTVILS